MQLIAFAFCLFASFNDSFAQVGSKDKDRNQTQLPEQAQKILQQLPERAITVDLVLGLGVKNSDQFKGIASQELVKTQALDQVEANLDAKVFANLNSVNNRHQTSGLFQPSAIETQALEVGLSKFFSTGTFVEAKISGSNVETTFKDFPPGFPANALPDPTLNNMNSKLTVSQDLLRDFFGASTAKALEAGEQAAKSKDFEIRKNVEDFSLQLIDAFYGTWQAQSKVTADRAKLSRQRELLRITEIQRRRGTAEEPDLLQIENALYLTEEALKESTIQLQNVWNQLVVLLKLPASLLEVDPTLIPIKIESADLSDLKYCSTQDFSQNQTLLAAEASVSSVNFDVARRRRAFLPDLKLNFIYDANGTDTSAEDVIRNSLYGRFPSTTLGLSFEMPLGNISATTQYKEGLRNQVLSEISLSQTKDSLLVERKNLCDELTRLNIKVERLEKVFASQKRRAELEQNRFRLAQIPAFNAITAENDVIDAELLLRANQALLRNAVWRLRKNIGLVTQRIETLAQTAPVVRMNQ